MIYYSFQSFQIQYLDKYKDEFKVQVPAVQIITLSYFKWVLNAAIFSPKKVDFTEHNHLIYFHKTSLHALELVFS